jgi:hypothetical protein
MFAACAPEIGNDEVGADKAAAPVDPETFSNDIAPTGRGGGTAEKYQQTPSGEGKPGDGGAGGSGGTTSTSNGISYHGGPLLLGNVNVYYIWYGGWTTSDPAANSILTDLASNIGGSPYFNINTTYYDSHSTHVANLVTLAGSTTDNYSQGTSIPSGGVAAIVANAIHNDAGGLPLDPNGVYFVLTSADVNEGSFCSTYCGYHDHTTINGADIKYAFIGDGSRCPSGCVAPAIRTKSPNGDVGADAMASVIAHELEEATTDPDLNAWFDRRGNENADKCAWTFGTEYAAPSGATANVHLGTRDFLIQQNWVNAAGGYCALAYP